MVHQVRLVLQPYYKIHAPICRVKINDKVIFTDKLSTQKTFELKTLSNNIDISIVRSGRSKSIVLNDNDNSILFEKLYINEIEIDPCIGSYVTSNNHYVEDHITNTNKFTLNGTYKFNVPFLTLAGESSIELPKNKFYDVVFFGASMTTWDFKINGVPRIKNGKSFFEIFNESQQAKEIAKFAKFGQTNQEIFDSIKKFYKNENQTKIAFIQLISTVGRQIKNNLTQKLERYQIHKKLSLAQNYIDTFTNTTPKQITDFFAFLNIRPILAAQLVEYKELVDMCTANNTKVFFISYFKDEHEVLERALPHNIAPYFDVDPNDEYVKTNGYHANPKEHKIFAEKLLTFYQNLL